MAATIEELAELALALPTDARARFFAVMVASAFLSILIACDFTPQYRHIYSIDEVPAVENHDIFVKGADRQVEVISQDELARTVAWSVVGMDAMQLHSKFLDHRVHGFARDEADYNAGARQTITDGTGFTFYDRSTGSKMLGFYDPKMDGFASVGGTGKYIADYFRWANAEQYVRDLPRSTYK